MARLNVQMVREEDFLSFPQIRGRPGVYLNVLTGDLFRNSGHFSEANQRIVEACECEEGDPLSRRPFLMITDSMDLSQLEAKELASRRFGVEVGALGKLVNSTE